MPKVRLLCNWFKQEYQHLLLENLMTQFVFEDNYDPKIEFTLKDDYDFLIVFNNFNHIKLERKIDKNKTIGFILEPPHVNQYFLNNLGTYCKKVYTCCDKKYYPNNNNFVSAPSVMFTSLKRKHAFYRKNTNFDKLKKVSLCFSSRNGTILYDLRHKIIDLIIKSDIDCDIYGKNLELKDSRYKGSPEDKTDALLDYEYSLAIENGIYDDYVSEKMFDCFLCNTVPIYLGAPNAGQIYNPNAFYKFPFSSFKEPYLLSPERFIKWLENLSKEKKGTNLKFKDSILESKELYFKRYNLYDVIKKEVYLA